MDDPLLGMDFFRDPPNKFFFCDTPNNFVFRFATHFPDDLWSTTYSMKSPPSKTHSHNKSTIIRIFPLITDKHLRLVMTKKGSAIQAVPSGG